MPPFDGQDQRRPKAKSGLINTDQVWSFAHEPHPSSIDQTLARQEQTEM